MGSALWSACGQLVVSSLSCLAVLDCRGADCGFVCAFCPCTPSCKLSVQSSPAHQLCPWFGSKVQMAYSPILSKQCMMASCVCSSYRKSDAEREEAELRPAAKNTTGFDTLLLGACCMFADNSQNTNSLLLALLLFLTFAVSG